MPHESLVVVLSVSAAFAFAASSSFKHVSAGQSSDIQSLDPGRLASFIRTTLSHPLWLAGIACDVVGVLLQIFALHLGTLAVVQPLLVSGLLFALVLRHLHDHRHVSRRQLAWAGILVGALSGFVVVASPVTSTAVHQTVDRLPAVVAGIIGLAIAAGSIELGRRSASRDRAAALLGIAVGVIYAGTAALLKALADIAAGTPFHLLLSWQLYVLVLLGAVGLLLNQIAFQAGPIAASLSAASTIDPLISIVIGVVIYDEHIARGPGGGIVLIALLGMLSTAVVKLAQPDPLGV